MSGVPVLNTQAMFYEQYEATRRDEVVGILLALFLGTFGAHHFYLRRTGLGILYLVFFWSGIPSILGFIECFFMPGRVREFNAIQAAGIAAALGMAVPAGWGWPINVTVNMPAYAAAGSPTAAGPYAAAGPFTATGPYAASGPYTATGPFTATTLPLPGALIACPNCQHTNVMGARFCSACGTAL